MLLLAALAIATPVSTQREATATVRIERPSVGARAEWESTPKSKRREARIRDEQGRELLLRLVENE